MFLYYGNSNNHMLISECEDEKSVSKEISKHLKLINFKSYYMRAWKSEEDKAIIYDFGSHVNFFFLCEEKIW